MLREYSLFLCLLAPAYGVAQNRAAQKPAEQSKQPHPNAASRARSTHQPSEGERVFAQNCSRCHAAPEAVPPSISATVVRHMRVRASLSAHDEQELLRFFNP